MDLIDHGRGSELISFIEQYPESFSDLVIAVTGRTKRLEREAEFDHAKNLESLMLQYTISYLNISDVPYKEAFARNLLEGIRLKYIFNQEIDLQSHVFRNTSTVYFEHKDVIEIIVYHDDWKAFWKSL